MQTADCVTPLSVAQERRLVDYLDARFLELTRGYKKRSILPNLPASSRTSSHVLFASLEG